METLDAIEKRVSVRSFQPAPVGKEDLEKLVDSGRRAPSARAIEPWEFVVVTERPMLSKLGQIADTGGFIAEAGACIAVFCKATKYYLEDGSAATENILLAATALGLSTCWVAGDKKPYAPEIEKLLGVPADVKLISLIAVGVGAKKTKQVKNRSLKEVLHWEKYRGKG
ncbi:MAG: nitroreductase family protein [Candidatus Omnitrophica bacterium]|nr:nitroreductase family protein [Candidatus Omnitrophota bacterium]